MRGNRIAPTPGFVFAPDLETGATADVAATGITADDSGSSQDYAVAGASAAVAAERHETPAKAPARGVGRTAKDAASRPVVPAPNPVERTNPDTWRIDMAAGDKAFLKTLDRFDNPAALAKAYRELTARLSSGELRAAKPPAGDASPAQIAVWRADHGLPENAEAYVAGLTLPGGTVPGKAEEPLLASFAEQALKSNWTSDQYNQAVGWYFAMQDRLMAQRQLADAQFKEQASSDLMREWRTDYAVNRNAVVQFFDRHFPQELKIDLLNARLSDGSMLANHPGFNKAILEVAKIVSPSGAVLPNTSGAGLASVESRIAEIEGKYMRAAHGSEPWKTYWTGEAGARMQQEYRGLLAGREQARRGRGA
jgi:hypothetical protein